MSAVRLESARAARFNRGAFSTAQIGTMADVFISYSRHDEQFVQRLREALAAEGKDVWVIWDAATARSWWRSVKARR